MIVQVDHSDDCSCCWITGFGVNEQEPNTWAEKIYSVDEECPDHGSRVCGVDAFDAPSYL